VSSPSFGRSLLAAICSDCVMKTTVAVSIISAIFICNGCGTTLSQPAYYDGVSKYLSLSPHKASAICLGNEHIFYSWGLKNAELAKVNVLDNCSNGKNTNGGTLQNLVGRPIEGSPETCNDCQLLYLDDDEVFDAPKYYELRDAEGAAQSAALVGAMTQFGMAAATHGVGSSPSYQPSTVSRASINAPNASGSGTPAMTTQTYSTASGGSPPMCPNLYCDETGGAHHINCCNQPVTYTNTFGHICGDPMSEFNTPADLWRSWYFNNRGPMSSWPRC
jgi:hypothetical protein